MVLCLTFTDPWDSKASGCSLFFVWGVTGIGITIRYSLLWGVLLLYSSKSGIHLSLVFHVWQNTLIPCLLFSLVYRFKVIPDFILYYVLCMLKSFYPNFVQFHSLFVVFFFYNDHFYFYNDHWPVAYSHWVFVVSFWPICYCPMPLFLWTILRVCNSQDLCSVICFCSFVLYLASISHCCIIMLVIAVTSNYLLLLSIFKNYYCTI